MQRKQFELSLSIVVLLIIFFLIFRSDVLLYLALFIGISCGASSYLRALFYKVFSFVLHIYGSIINRLILTLIYIAVLCPIALLRKFFKKTAEKSNNHLINSAFVSRDHSFQPQDFINPW